MKSAMKKTTAMKAKVMKTMKAMKAKSVIAKGVMAKSQVFKGLKSKTQSGLTKDKLVKNKSGKIVSKARSARGKKVFSSTLGAWKSCGGGSQGPRDPGLLSHGRKVSTRKGILCQGQVPLQCLSLPELASARPCIHMYSFCLVQLMLAWLRLGSRGCSRS